MEKIERTRKDFIEISENLSKKDYNISDFLREISELYSDCGFWNLDKKEFLRLMYIKLYELYQIDKNLLKYHINKPIYENGESELMFVFRWKRNDEELLCNWFKLLLKFGGDPLKKNLNGQNSYDIALSYGLSQEDIKDLTV